MKKSAWIVAVFLILNLVACTPQSGESQNKEGLQQDNIQHSEEISEDSNLTDNNLEKEEVINLVEEFGQTLQLVSILAPEDILKEAIKEKYSNFITSSLLSKWLSDPESAPGREVSSPWPDRIEISSIEKSSENTYEVRGKIIEITSVELEQGGSAAERPITLTIRKVDNRWLIDKVSVGEYNDINNSAVSYTNEKYGFRLILPASWRNYQIVTDRWEGTPLAANQMAENGPILSVRHPKWTKENPRQDIPIMIFTHSQWESIQNEKFSVGAAPITPKKLNQNKDYVFALPARYNFAFLEGYEEVEKIVENGALQIIEN
ncbi:hypothetical protein [Schinkia azotoformans]|uniref:hypothetical protein n=1 Tax=Schinkia azotoformans TaxID=1454 RepID=UPI002DBDA4E5|nr:hypothetical protein [Schinkia azotoformans]MEC1716257.1 hypothetical protein [Schinkia azotoformans]MEC1741634.1 hypothetical protein [Schinkia azotoformans]MEC1745656.1 hypothetical protein [Schinkia azotoformans]MEC1758974.1 hypothetical protein [Schinkia azotoformans]MEC1766854.1 hypothetical protein [Schinkia azotoformans]